MENNSKKSWSQSNKSGLCVVVVDTSIQGKQGSMAAYARLVERVLSQSEHQAVEVAMINIAPSLVLVNKFPRRIQTVMYHAILTVNALRRIRRSGADIVHLVDGSVAHIVKWFPDISVVVTAHDIIPFLQSTGKFSVEPPGLFARWIINLSLKGLEKAGHVIAVSKNTKRDLINKFDIHQRQISVVQSALPLSIIDYKQSSRHAQWAERCKSNGWYIFHIGHNGFYKNREGVLRIFSRIRKKVDIRLKMAGPRPSKMLQELVKTLGLSDFVDFIVDAGNEEIGQVYNAACLFLFPSLYEGFGWPPLEAMALGCPVVCSNRASLPEVLGDAALTADPEDEERMATLSLSILQDNSLANQLIEKGLKQAEKFSAEKMGQQLVDVYKKVKVEHGKRM